MICRGQKIAVQGRRGMLYLPRRTAPPGVPSKLLATHNGHCWGLAYAFETTDSFEALKKQTIESSKELLDLPGSEETMI